MCDEIFAPHAVQDAITPTRTYSPIFMIAAVYLQVVSVQGQCAGAQHSRYFLNTLPTHPIVEGKRVEEAH